MGTAKPVTDEERERVRQLHAEGKGRNEIAEILGRGGRTISTIAKDLGLSFSRAAEVRQAKSTTSTRTRPANPLPATSGHTCRSSPPPSTGR